MAVSISIEDIPEITIPLDNSPEISIQISSPVSHISRECPGAPKKANPYKSYTSLEEEVENLYRKAESTNAIRYDDGYFPIGARCLVGRKLYKTFSIDSPTLISMKVLLILVKSSFGWLRTNVKVEESVDDSQEWDVEFVY